MLNSLAQEYKVTEPLIGCAARTHHCCQPNSSFLMPVTWLCVVLRWNSLQMLSKGSRISSTARSKPLMPPRRHLSASLAKRPVRKSSKLCVCGCTLIALTLCEGEVIRGGCEKSRWRGEDEKEV